MSFVRWLAFHTCNFIKSEANKFAQDKGYKDAHDLKESYVGKRNISKYDIYHNQKTQESFLIDKKGITIIPIE